MRYINVSLPVPAELYARPTSQAHTATSTPGFVKLIVFPHWLYDDGTVSLIGRSTKPETSTNRAATNRCPPDHVAMCLSLTRWPRRPPARSALEHLPAIP